MPRRTKKTQLITRNDRMTSLNDQPRTTTEILSRAGARTPWDGRTSPATKTDGGMCWAAKVTAAVLEGTGALTIRSYMQEKVCLKPHIGSLNIIII